MTDWVLTTIDYAGQEGEDVYTFLTAAGIAVRQVDYDQDQTNLLITADRDVAWLMASFTPPDPPAVVDLVQLVLDLTGTDPTAAAAARTALVDVQAAGVRARIGGHPRHGGWWVGL